MRAVDIQHRWRMTEAGKALGSTLDGYGFCVIATDMGTRDGRIHYLSNVELTNMIAMLKQFTSDCETQLNAK